MALGSRELEELLSALGAILQSHDLEAGIVVVGGAALLLQDLQERTTTGIDVIATGRPRAAKDSDLQGPASLPVGFQQAVETVARDFQLPADWLNYQVSAQLRTGLPPGMAKRLMWRQYGGLWVGLANRKDLIFLKLFAAADQDAASRHVQDLLVLRPTEAELDAAAAWAGGQDASPEFGAILQDVVRYVREHTR